MPFSYSFVLCIWACRAAAASSAAAATQQADRDAVAYSLLQKDGLHMSKRSGNSRHKLTVKHTKHGHNDRYKHARLTPHDAAALGKIQQKHWEQALRRRLSEDPQKLCGAGFTLRPDVPVVITSAVAIPSEYLPVMERNRLAYATEYGYDVCILTTDFNYVNRSIGGNLMSYATAKIFDPANREHYKLGGTWIKIALTRALHEIGKQVVFQIDADALILHPRPISEIPGFTAGKDCIFTSEYNGSYQHINTGVYISRLSNWTTTFWESIWNDYPEWLHVHWHEQSAINEYMNKKPEPFIEHTFVMDNTYMNKHGWKESMVNEDTFIVHAWGPMVPELPDSDISNYIRLKTQQGYMTVLNSKTAKLDVYRDLLKEFCSPQSKRRWCFSDSPPTPHG